MYISLVIKKILISIYLRRKFSCLCLNKKVFLEYMEAFESWNPFALRMLEAEELSQEGRFDKSLRATKRRLRQLQNYMTPCIKLDVNEASQFIQQSQLSNKSNKYENY